VNGPAAFTENLASTRKATEIRTTVKHQSRAVNIGGTTTKTGLTVKALLDTTSHEPGQKITDDEMRAAAQASHVSWRLELHARATQGDLMSNRQL
jgi:hypothetical protein